MAKYNITAEEDLEVKPCPFCGSTSILIKQITRNDSPSKGHWYTHCEGCWAEGPFADGTLHRGDAVKQWNRRDLP